MAPLDPRAWEAACLGSTEEVAEWLDVGGDIDARNPFDQCTLLMAAAIPGHAELVELLLSRNASINLRAARGGTALMFAVGHGHRPTVQLLLRAGASTEMKSFGASFTAFKWAEAQGHTDVARLLREHEGVPPPSTSNPATVAGPAAAAPPAAEPRPTEPAAAPSPDGEPEGDAEHRVREPAEAEAEELQGGAGEAEP